MLPTPRTIWKSAELLIAFHSNQLRERRDEPFLWRPKDAIAWLRGKPKDREAFVVLKGEGEAKDVQIKLHPDKMVIRRDQTDGWAGIIVDEHDVRVLVGGAWIKISADGTVTAEREDDTTYLEGDGSIIRITPDAEIFVSGDGRNITRRTAEKIEAFGEDGFVSKKRKGQRPALPDMPDDERNDSD